MEPLFRNVAQITCEAVTSALRSAQAICQSTIASIRAEPIIGKASFNAQVFRLHLTYNQQESESPNSLVAKLPAGNMELHENAAVFQPGRKETWFYQHGANHTPVRTPRCYYNSLDPITGQSILLLEDLAPAQNGNQLDGASISKAKLALESAARLHAAWWGKEQVRAMLSSNGVENLSAAAENLVQRLFREAWPRFIAHSGDGIPEGVRQFGDYLTHHVSGLSSLLDNSPKTLTHGDFRLDNMLFGKSGEDMLCWIIDWEDIDFGNGPYDVAWFIGGCLDIASPSEEQNLLESYYDRLVREGVKGYTWTECQRDYCYAMSDAFVQGVLMATNNKPDSTYHTQLANVVGRRFVHACDRLQLNKLIAM